MRHSIYWPDAFEPLLQSAVIVAVALCCFFLLVHFRPQSFLRTNFQGRSIPTSAGLVLGIPAFLASFPALTTDSMIFAFGFLTAGFALLGRIDDVYGDRSAGGFRGHFRKLLRERKVTTGVIKVIGGGVLALAAGWWTETFRFTSSTSDLHAQENAINLAFHSILIALAIALAANTCNLLDLRPGRCLLFVIAASIPLSAALFLRHYESTAIYCCSCYLLVAALALFIFDRRANLMIGDTGSNAFGAGIGLLTAFILPYWAIGVLVAALAAFQVWCEKRSLSRYIEERPLLRALDRKIGVR